MNVILASASERRQELLKKITTDFSIKISDFREESVTFEGNIIEYVENIALGKAKCINSQINDDSIIIAADTIVAYENKILGKPKNKEDAYEMLSLLSGNKHYVYTGLVLINTKSKEILKWTEKTEVEFSKLTKEEIIKYIDTKEPMDKAGAYGIQGLGGVFVKGIKGCYYNVVGLPLNRLKYMLENISN